MGDIKKIRKKYQTPAHPWQRERIDAEKTYMFEYGFKNKREIWVMSSLLSKFKTLAKTYIGKPTKQSDREAAQLLTRLRSIGLLTEASTLNDVLTLTDKDIFERRLQTVVFRKGFARSVKQARQFITHNHIIVNGISVTSPAYIVKKSEEASIAIIPSHTLAKEDHPERVVITKKPKKVQQSRDPRDRRRKPRKN